jgi:hypothetical protein
VAPNTSEAIDAEFGPAKDRKDDDASWTASSG